jgi:uncharacterized integral membrane protein (TIGR00697 family)
MKMKERAALYTRPEDLKNIRAWSPIYVILACIFCATLMISNLAAAKLIQGPFGILIDGGFLMFPIIYIFGDVLTEVYGFKRSRLVIWMGLVCNLMMAILMALVVAAPYPDFFEGQGAYAYIFTLTPVIVSASMLGYFFGEMSNSIVLSKMKVKMGGKKLWARTISSTIVGEGVDTLIFSLLVYGPLGMALGWDIVIYMTLLSYGLKVLYEVLATPMTYKVVGYIKEKERTDIYDNGVSYNPFNVGDL